MIKDDEDLLKLFERMPDYLICEDKIAQTAAVLQVDHVCHTVCAMQCVVYAYVVVELTSA